MGCLNILTVFLCVRFHSLVFYIASPVKHANLPAVQGEAFNVITRHIRDNLESLIVRILNGMPVWQDTGSSSCGPKGESWSLLCIEDKGVSREEDQTSVQFPVKRLEATMERRFTLWQPNVWLSSMSFTHHLFNHWSESYQPPVYPHNIAPLPLPINNCFASISQVFSPSRKPPSGTGH